MSSPGSWPSGVGTGWLPPCELSGPIPTGSRPSRGDIFGTIAVNYKLLLNVLGLVIFAALFWLTARRGVTDPVCGMKVDKAKAIRKDLGAESFYFCSKHCLYAFQASPADQLEEQSASVADRSPPR